MRICFHSHCFPDGLAPHAMEVLRANCAPDGLGPSTDGTAACTEKLLSGAGIDAALICNIATNTHQEHKVNDFAISLAKESRFFYATGSVHPDSEHQDAELDRLMAAGIRGIKLHPDYVHIPLSDKRFDRIFSKLEERGLFVVVHAGLDPISPDFIHAPAKTFHDIQKKHPKLTLIAAHMGAYHQSEEVLRYLVGTDIYIDTSLCSRRDDERENLLRILHEHDSERILFGTDTPWGIPQKEIAFIEGAGLSAKQKENIFYKNAMRLLGISAIKSETPQKI